MSNIVNMILILENENQNLYYSATMRTKCYNWLNSNTSPGTGKYCSPIDNQFCHIAPK